MAIQKHICNLWKKTQKIYENKHPNVLLWIPDCVANYKCLGSEGYDPNQHPDSSILNLSNDDMNS